MNASQSPFASILKNQKYFTPERQKNSLFFMTPQKSNLQANSSIRTYSNNEIAEKNQVFAQQLIAAENARTSYQEQEIQDEYEIQTLKERSVKALQKLEGIEEKLERTRDSLLNEIRALPDVTILEEQLKILEKTKTPEIEDINYFEKLKGICLLDDSESLQDLAIKIERYLKIRLSKKRGYLHFSPEVSPPSEFNLSRQIILVQEVMDLTQTKAEKDIKNLEKEIKELRKQYEELK
jgi:hypothetical protein